MQARASWIAIDWGTSNVRAWGIGTGGEPVFKRRSDRGMSRLDPSAYAQALRDLLAGSELPDPVDVLVCGMAGARQGWHEAPYLDLPADLGGLGLATVSPPGADLAMRVRIVPGVCDRAPGFEDVMRGEETQLLGLSGMRPGFAGLVCMPGTHSKWAYLDGTRLERFSTAMTGELFEVVSAHTVLRHSLGGKPLGPATEDGIEDGLAAGLDRPARLTSLMFRTRAAALLSERTPDWCAGYLSGLLVGAEIGGFRDEIGTGPVPVIGDNQLARLYAAGLKRIGVEPDPIDATRASLAGLSAVHQQIHVSP